MPLILNCENQVYKSVMILQASGSKKPGRDLRYLMDVKI